MSGEPEEPVLADVCVPSGEQIAGSRVIYTPLSYLCALGKNGDVITVLDRAYFVRQIRTLLRFAKSTSDPRLAAFLMDKAVQLKSQVEERPPAADISPRAPDVEPQNERPPHQ
jgi:hypothetical protein